MNFFKFIVLLYFSSFFQFSRAEEINFFPVENYKTGDTPMALAAGDLNGDTTPDLAVANLLDNTVSILTNNGDGTFTFEKDLIANAPGDIRLVDVEKDNDLDLIVTDILNNSVNIFKNSGSGNFPAMPNINPINLPGFPATIEVADLNQDNTLDLAVGMAGNGSRIRILTNNGNGNFTLGNFIFTFSQVFSLGLGHFNGDNFPDIVAPSFASSIRFSTNNGTGSFSFKDSLFLMNNTLPISIESSDLDGDNDQDLAVGLASAGPNSTIAILKNNGVGNFTMTTNYLVDNPTFMTLKDLGRDGDVDIAVARNNTNLISLLLNNGDGTFGAPLNFQVGEKPRSIQVHDVDNDGGQDIIVVNSDDTTLSVLRSRFLGVSDIPDQLSFQNQLAGPYPFQLLGQISNVVLSAKSSNTNLVPNANITLGGAGKNRTIALQPLQNKIGGTLITVTATNTVESLAASDSFVLAVVNNTNNPPLPPPNQTNIVETNVVINSLTALGYTLDIKKPKLGKQIRLKTEAGLRKFKARIITINSVNKVSYALSAITNTIFTNLDFVLASKLKETKKRIFEKRGIKYKVTNLRNDPKTGKNLSTGTDFINLVIKIEGIIQTNPATVYLINTFKASVK